MARYTVQFIIAGYALPAGNDVFYADSQAAIKRQLQREHDAAENVGAGYEPSEALVWKGELEDVTDQYPDYRATIGARGGVRWERC